MCLENHEISVTGFYVSFKGDLLNPFWAKNMLAEAGGDVNKAIDKIYQDLNAVNTKLQKTAIFGSVPPTVHEPSTARIFERQMWAIWILATQKQWSPFGPFIDINSKQATNAEKYVNPVQFPDAIANRFTDLHIMSDNINSNFAQMQKHIT